MGLVMAKAPVPGEVKTRLAVTVGAVPAARLAAAALLDTMHACAAAFERRFLVLSGDLDAAIDGAAITAASRGWTVVAQRGRGLGERLAHAHADVHALTGAPTVQVGMDTPQVSPATLVAIARALVRRTDGVLGPAEDGGWWVLGMADPTAAGVLGAVAMSTPTTGAATRIALQGSGLRLRPAPTMRDVDTAEDAAAIALLAPRTRFARAWRTVDAPLGPQGHRPAADALAVRAS